MEFQKCRVPLLNLRSDCHFQAGFSICALLCLVHFSLEPPVVLSGFSACFFVLGNTLPSPMLLSKKSGSCFIALLLLYFLNDVFGWPMCVKTQQCFHYSFFTAGTLVGIKEQLFLADGFPVFFSCFI